MSNVIETKGTRLRIIPRDSVKLDNQTDNIEQNLKLIRKWLPKVKHHDRVCYFTSAGPSLERLLVNGFITNKTFEETGSDLFCVKHALPILARHGVVPRFCVVLDPRELDKESTHGVLRRSLFEAASKETTFLVSSSTNPTVTQYLLDQGYLVIGWHAAVQGMDKFKDRVPYWLSGGTCAATRGLILANFMGYSKANLIGYDSSLSEKPSNPEEKTYFDDEVNWNTFVDYKRRSVDWEGAERWVKENSQKNEVPRYLPLRIKSDKIFWSTGELAAQLQDLENFLTDHNFPMELRLIGCDKESHAAGALYDSLEKQNATIRPRFEEVFG
jgi:Protein of unknown function DUF115